jgi:diguanylate cyclase (GGDEF)-like protein
MKIIMMKKHLCPCCTEPLLRHISSQRSYWFCHHCYQEMPDIENLLETKLTSQHSSKNRVVAHNLSEEGWRPREKWYHLLETNQYHLLETNQELQRLAFSDSLTQAANHLRFKVYLDQEWRRMASQQTSLSLILGDFDCFRAYNDTYGRQAGDKCLQQVAGAIIRAVKRPADVVPRYGGEEFVVILPSTKAEDALRVAEEIRCAIKALEIVNTNSPFSNYLTLSLGVASIIPSHEYSSTILLSAAAHSLTQAKAQGRDRVILYENLLRQSKVVEQEKTPALPQNPRGVPASESDEKNDATTKTDLLMSYVAYYVSRGKVVISPLSGSLSFEGLVYRYWGYHRDFQEFWRQLQQRRDFGELYIEGDLYSFSQFLGGSCTVSECARCNLPVPMSEGSVRDTSNCTLCIDSWLLHQKLNDIEAKSLKDESNITRVVAIGATPSNYQTLKEWFSINGFEVTFVSRPEDLTPQSLPRTVDLVLIHGEVSEAQGKAWAKELSRYPQFQDVPIVALSADAGYGLPWIERTLGVEDYVLTPYSGKLLAHYLRQVLKPQLSNEPAALHWFPI